MCDRVNNCGYHLTPKQWFQQNGETVEQTSFLNKQESEIRRQRSYLEPALITQLYEHTNFFKALLGNLDRPKEDIMKACDIYKLGGGRNKGVVFYYIDKYGMYRTGKIMNYTTECKRQGNPSWVHKYDSRGDKYELDNCLFGEHLYFEEFKKPIAIVESEKTAIIASLYYPNYLWLASGSATHLNGEKLRNLGGREIVLFPDAAKWDDWNSKFGRTCWVDEVTRGLKGDTDLADLIFDTIKNKAITHEFKKMYEMWGILRIEKK